MKKNFLDIKVGDKVIVYDEWLGNADYHSKWLYTAVTRASKMLVVVK